MNQPLPYYDFYDSCRIFLESMIEKNPENKELVNAYIKLIETYSKREDNINKLNIEQYKSNTEYNKELMTNQHDYQKTLLLK